MTTSSEIERRKESGYLIKELNDDEGWGKEGTISLQRFLELNQTSFPFARRSGAVVLSLSLLAHIR